MGGMAAQETKNANFLAFIDDPLNFLRLKSFLRHPGPTAATLKI